VGAEVIINEKVRNAVKNGKPISRRGTLKGRTS